MFVFCGPSIARARRALQGSMRIRAAARVLEFFVALELLLVLAMTTGPRIHHRAAGLQASEINGEDGLR